MAVFAGYRGKSIGFVGSSKPLASDFDVIEVKAPLDTVPAKELLERFEVRRGQVVAKTGNKAAGARVALVSVFGVPCGIATYSHWLWDAMLPLVGEGHVFSEIEDVPTVDGVTQCWERGKPLGNLVSALKDYDPDLVIVQHEYGNYPVARHWLSFMGALAQFNTVVTLHSVYSHRDKTIVEASCPNIVVHTEAARRMLVEEKQVSGRVTVIPHGCNPCVSREKLWNLYASDHTILQSGFAFPYKNHADALRVVAALKTDYPDVFYTALLSERWPGAHEAYIRELQDQAYRMGIGEHVALIRGFQSDPVLDSFLRTNRVALFPYGDQGDHTVLGCSGAARVAMTAGVPVVASSVPLFDDLQGVVPRPSNVSGWADAVSALFESPGAQLDAQDRFLAENSWESAAESYLALLP